MGAHNYLVHGPHLIPILEINKLRRPAHSWAVAELFRARVYLTRRLRAFEVGVGGKPGGRREQRLETPYLSSSGWAGQGPGAGARDLAAVPRLSDLLCDLRKFRSLSGLQPALPKSERPDQTISH